HAMERRPQRRLLARQSPAALPAADHRSRVSLRSRQRRKPAEQPALAPVVDETADLVAQTLSSVRARRARDPAAAEPKGSGARAAPRRAKPSRRGESFAIRPARRSRSVRVSGPTAPRALRPDELSADRRSPLRAD